MACKHYFDKYTCIGDFIVLEKEGITFNVSIEYDDMCKPTDVECYSEADIQAWKNDEWNYCGIVFHASKNGVEIGCVASLWGIEIGDYFKDYHLYINDEVNNMLDDALEEAKKQVQYMLENLSA